MAGKIYKTGKVDVYIDLIIDSFLNGFRSDNLGAEPARWMVMGLKDLEDDPVIKSWLTPTQSKEDQKSSIDVIQSSLHKRLNITWNLMTLPTFDPGYPGL